VQCEIENLIQLRVTHVGLDQFHHLNIVPIKRLQKEFNINVLQRVVDELETIVTERSLMPGLLSLQQLHPPNVIILLPLAVVQISLLCGYLFDRLLVADLPFLKEIKVATSPSLTRILLCQ
jgi:hypothetical protein